jgi:hypothetical protein
VRWVLVSTLVLIGLAALPGRAAAKTFYADLDHDGIRDVVTIQMLPATGLRVWLSGSNRYLLLPTQRPIVAVKALAIDDEGGIDLIASDTSARVHVWHRSVKGGLRPRSRHGPRAPAGVSRSGRVTNAPDDAPIAVVDDSPTSSPIDAAHPAGLSTLNVSSADFGAASLASSLSDASPPKPRGPPLGA